MIGKIKEVHIVLENCDFYRIPAQSIMSIICRDICKDILVNSIGQIIELNTCKHFGMTLERRSYLSEWQDRSVEKLDDFDFEKRMVYNDIASIQYVLMDNTKIVISVPFSEEKKLIDSDLFSIPNGLQKFNKKLSYYEITISKEFIEK